MKKYISFISIVILIGMFGCKVGPDFETPVVQTEPYFRYDSLREDTVINLMWWELFQDEQLQALIKVAIEENKDVRIAAARVEESRAYLGYNKADLWPKFGYEASASRSNLNLLGTGTNSPQNVIYAGAPVMSWELDFWGKYRRSTEAARAEMFASQYSLRTVLISLISEVAANYFMLLDFKNRYAISKDTYESRQQSTDLIQARFDKGIVPELDLNQAQIQEAIAASAVPNYERAVAITEHALSILLGRNPGAITVSDSLSKDLLPPGIPAGIPSELLQRRPDILEAEQLAAAQTARIGVAQAMRFPSISLTGLLGIASTSLSGISIAGNGAWSASAGLLGPIFEFGKNKRRVEIERKRAEQLVYAYENTVLGAFKEVEDALVEVHTYGTEIDAVLRRMKAANNAMDLSWARYNGGVTSYLEVLYQENEKFNAQLRASEVFMEQLNAYVKLYKALGGGWISEEEKKMAEEAEAEAAQQK